jgi:asparagine synthase (glutamine-hydrolysing)
MPDLGRRLAHRTAGLLEASRIDAFISAWQGGRAAIAEQVLQLLLLDESLDQLAALCLVD